VAATKPAILAALHKHDTDSAELHTRRHILEAAGYDTEGSGLTVGQLPPMPQPAHEPA
jgi:hypothetical protein